MYNKKHIIYIQHENTTKIETILRNDVMINYLFDPMLHYKFFKKLNIGFVMRILQDHGR